MLKKSVFLFSLLITVAACDTGLDPTLIQGKWEGTSVLEEGEPLPVDVSEIQFEFRDNNEYEYSSTLKYKEAGTYYMEDNYLFTTDTFNQASTEKVVEIVLLDGDSLHLKMKEQGQERILKLRRL
jgi:hypothetical protein